MTPTVVTVETSVGQIKVAAWTLQESIDYHTKIEVNLPHKTAMELLPDLLALVGASVRRAPGQESWTEEKLLVSLTFSDLKELQKSCILISGFHVEQPGQSGLVN